MPIPLPNLDDRAFKDLLDEGLSLIPAHAPEWTNHNPSDPGIAFVELFAYLSEMLIYRQNRVTDENVKIFLKLLHDPNWKMPDNQSLSAAISETVLQLRETYRAVTCDDYEYLALKANEQVSAQAQALTTPLQALAQTLGDFLIPTEAIKNIDLQSTIKQTSEAASVARAHCLANRNLEDSAKRGAYSLGHMSVIVVPSNVQGDSVSASAQTENLCRTVKDYLEPRRLVGTRLHVVGPQFLQIGLRFTLYRSSEALEINEKVILDEARSVLQEFLHPLHGGFDKKGWPFGRSVYISELYKLLAELPEVHHVSNLDPQTGKYYDEIIVNEADAGRIIRSRAESGSRAELVALDLLDDELPSLSLGINLALYSMDGSDTNADQH